MLFLDFFENLRTHGLKVTTHEWLALMEALQAGAVRNSLMGFYWTSRALLVKRESDYDRFDLAFAQTFDGVEASGELIEQILEWLSNKKEMPQLTSAEFAALEAHDLETLRRLFEERLKEQEERHDGGNRWIGTGGTSPFGHGGMNPAGVRVGGGGGGRRAMQVATQRDFANYRDDLVLDIRQTQVALRKLRRLIRHGQDQELDLDETVDRTGKNAGDLEVVFRPPRRNQVRLILLMDTGGSMTPYANVVSTIFTAASKSTHWKRFEAYYFHNCPYGEVWEDAWTRKAKSMSELIAESTEGSVLIMVGDATMHPAELTESGGAIDYWTANETPGVEWLKRLRRAFPDSVWINPLPSRWWNAPSCRLVREVFPMHPMTLSGIDSAVTDLRAGRARNL